MEVVTEENIRRIEEELLSDRRLKLKEISARLEISKTTVFRIIREHLHMKKVSARWVPRLLSSIQKEHRLMCCQKILDICHGNQKEVLESFVTGDETMILYQKGNQWNGGNQAKYRQEGRKSLNPPTRSWQRSSGIAEEFCRLISKKGTPL